MAGVHVGHMATNPNPDQSPVLSGIVGTLLYENVGMAAYDAVCSFTLTTGAASWLYGVNFYALPYTSTPGDTSATFNTDNPSNLPWYQLSPPTQSGQYTADYKSLTSGIGYDLYIAFVDNAGGVSVPLYLVTTSTNPMQNNAFPGVGAFTISAAAVSLGTPSVQAGGAWETLPVTLTPTYNFPIQNCAELKIIAFPAGLAQSAINLYNNMTWAWGVGVLPQANILASGTPCTINVVGVPASYSVDLYVYAVGFDGSYIYPTTDPIATTSGQSTHGWTVPVMPSGATISVSGVSSTAVDANTSGAQTYGASNTGSVMPALSITFTLGDTNVPTSAFWGSAFLILTRLHSSSGATNFNTYEQHPCQPKNGYIGPGSYTFQTGVLCPGEVYDIALAIQDQLGNLTNTVTLVSNYTVPLGGWNVSSMLNGQGSLVPAASNFSMTCKGANPTSGGTTGPQIQYYWAPWSWITADGTAANYTSGYPSGEPTTYITATTDYLGAAITAGSSYYVYASYNWGTTGNVTTYFVKGTPTQAGAHTFFSDGQMQLVAAQGPITIPSSGGTPTTYNPTAGAGTGKYQYQ